MMVFDLFQVEQKKYGARLLQVWCFWWCARLLLCLAAFAAEETRLHPSRWAEMTSKCSPETIGVDFLAESWLLKTPTLSQKEFARRRSHLWTFYLPRVLITRFKALNSVVCLPFCIRTWIPSTAREFNFKIALIYTSARGVPMQQKRQNLSRASFLIKRLSRAECGGSSSHKVDHVPSATRVFESHESHDFSLSRSAKYI